jgi:tetratricopeptide (TPR) repeat protein
LRPKRININPVVCRYFILWLLLSLSPLFSRADKNDRVPYRRGIFTSAKSLPDSTRVDMLRKIYKDNCRKMNEHDAMRCLDELTKIAQNINDLSLECAVYDMRADYYSVNNGYNATSTRYIDEAISFAEREGLKMEVGIYQHRKAIYYFVYKLNAPACRYFLLSEENLREVGFKNVPGISGLFSETADFYYSLGDFEDARRNLEFALKYIEPQSYNRINILNTIGLTYRNGGQFSTAMNYFNTALKIAHDRKDSVWIAITSGNIGSIYFRLRQYDKALPLIRADYHQSLKYNQTLNSAIALLRLVKISIDQNKLKQAGLQLDTADNILKATKEDVLVHRVKYYELKAQLSGKKGDALNAVLYRTRFEQVRDSVARRDNVAAIERVKLQWEMDKNRAEITRLKTIGENDAFKQDTIIVVLLLLIIISILIYNHQRLKGKKDKELLALEKRRVDEELKNATLSLHGYTENLMRKNVLIEEFKSEVEKLQLKFDNADGAEQLDKMMQAHIMTDENWNDFKKLFNRVHTTFFYNLRNKYPHLSGTDVRLVALIKLRLNNREMAGMMGITVDGIKKSKQRLRKKMELSADIEIEDIVLSL